MYQPLLDQLSNIRLQDSTSNFNQLLMFLSVVDSLVIGIHIVNDSFFPVFWCDPEWFTALFPFVLSPLKFIARTASIFMVVAISAERLAKLENTANQHSPQKIPRNECCHCVHPIK